MKLLRIYGVRYCDIVLYLAKILTNLDKKVLICDRSITKALRYYLPVPDEYDLNKDVFMYCGFGYSYNTRLLSGVNSVHASGHERHNYGAIETGMAVGSTEISMAAETTGIGMSAKASCSNTETKKERRSIVAEIKDVSMTEETSKVEKAHNFRILRDSIRESCEESAFDFAIVLCDASAAANDCWDEAMSERSVRLFITDELPDNVSDMKNAINAVNKASRLIKEIYYDPSQSVYKGSFPDGKSCFVVRDYSGKLTGVIDELILNAGAGKNFLLPYSSKDRQLEILASCNEGFKFAGASTRLQTLLESLCDDLGVMDDKKRFMQAFISAEKGMTAKTRPKAVKAVLKPVKSSATRGSTYSGTVDAVPDRK